MIGILAALGLALAGCSGDSDDAKPTEESSSTTSATAAEPGPTEPVDTDNTTPPPSDATDGATPTDPPTTKAPPTTEAPVYTLEPTQSRGFPEIQGEYLPVTSRVGIHPDYDRLVVEYKAGGKGSLEWSAAYVPEAIEDASGHVIEMEGEAILQITVTGIRIPFDDEPYDYNLDPAIDSSSVIKDARVSSSFEGRHMIYIGLDQKRPYRVDTTKDTVRIIVDFEK